MQRFVKSYWPYLIGMLLFFACGGIFGFMAGEGLASKNHAYFLLILGLIIIAVIGCWAEIIGYIIHAAKNDKLFNKVLWCFLIYLFNIFIVPYYNLKYVVKRDKVLPKMIIYVLLLGSCIIGGFFFTYDKIESTSHVLKLVSEEKAVAFTLEGNYIERQVGEYDLYATDYQKNLNFGVFIYDEGVTAEDVHEFQVDWLNKSRDNVKKVDEDRKGFNDVAVFTEDFYGELNGEKFIYSISSIEDISSLKVVGVLQVVFEEDYDKYKDILRKNIESISVN